MLLKSTRLRVHLKFCEYQIYQCSLAKVSTAWRFIAKNCIYTPVKSSTVWYVWYASEQTRIVYDFEGSLLIPAYHQHLLPRVFGHILSQTFLGTSSIPNQILPQLFPSDSSLENLDFANSRFKPNQQSLKKYVIFLGWSLGILATVFPVPRHTELRCCHR